MELSEIQQYSHKIIKIRILNTNTKTSYSHVTVKINFKEVGKETNEVVRFSTTENPSPSEWIEHQSSDNDFFLRIPNQTPSIQYVYAHFFPASLYDYTEDTQIFSIYDFSDFIKVGQLDEDGNPMYPVNKWNGTEYPLQITSYGYEMLLGNDNKPLIRSLLNGSVTRYKDPNYKNYITTNIKGDKNPITNLSDMTEKGRFPLSSRYRQSLYKTAPNLDDKENLQLPHWRIDNITHSYGAQRQTAPVPTDSIEEGFFYDDNTAGDYQKKYGITDNCGKRDTITPYWEAKIHRTGLTALIDEMNDDPNKYTPINVYLNYQYLPTSTEYHQHYFGFENKNVKDVNGNDIEHPIFASEFYDPLQTDEYNQNQTNLLKSQIHDFTSKMANGTYRQVTPNKTYEVLDGEKLQEVNENFGANTTYRLIRHGNPYDTTNIMYINHENILNINLDEDIQIIDNCSWIKNQCSKKQYWTYIPEGAGAAYTDITLKAHTYYVLKYFMFIPGDAYVEDDSCYMEVQSHTASNKDKSSSIDSKIKVVGELSQTFKNQDKKLRHQWIYHEIPFYTYEANNRIYIKGPQHNHEDTIGIHKTTGEVIYDLTEDDKNNPYIELHDCKNDVIHFYSIQIAEMVEYSPTLKYTQTGLHVVEENKYIKKSLKEASVLSCTEDKQATNEWENTIDLPIPDTDIYIFFKDNFEIIYNKFTTKLYYIKNDIFSFDNFNEGLDEVLTWSTDDSKISLQYDKNTSPIENKEGNETQNQYYNRIATNLGQNADNRDEADLDLNELFLGELKLFNEQRVLFTTGINNKIELILQDAYGNPVTTGEVECSIWTSDKEDKTPCSQAEQCLGTQKPDEYGNIIYSHLNFKKLKPHRETYYLRIVYKNACLNKDIIQWKELHFVEEHRNIYIYSNNCDKKICKAPSDCCTLQSHSIISQDNEYDRFSMKKNIDSVDELPLRLDAVIKNQLGNDINEGYCELSVNDKVIQTTFVDDNGVADFYLDEFDLNDGEQIIKIEYFINPSESMNFAFFAIDCRTAFGYDERPAIPIKINTLTNDIVQQLSTNIFTLRKDDIFFADIDTENHKDFSITIERNGVDREIINITEVMDSNYTITAMYDKNIQSRQSLNSHLKDDNNQDIDKYVITTGNLKDENGDEINKIYRPVKKEFTLLWKDDLNISEN